MKIIVSLTFFLFMSATITAQANKPVTRIARITVDSAQLKPYMLLLKEQMQTAVREEPGVISYRVFTDKTHPFIITIFEQYASEQAYLAHREAPHFKKYKTATAGMVKALELSEVEAVIQAEK